MTSTSPLASIRTTSHCSAMRSLGKGLRDCCDLAGQVSRQHRDQRWQISGWQRDLELDAGRYDTFLLQTIEQSPRLDDHVGIDGFDGRRVEPRADWNFAAITCGLTQRF